MVTTTAPHRVAYLLKMYPRFSETFIVNEILAHEAAGLAVEIFSLRAPTDGRFHADYARVQAPVTYLHAGLPKVTEFWQQIQQTAKRFPALWDLLRDEPTLGVDDLYQALLLAPLVVDRQITLLHAHFGSVATTVARLVSRLTGIPYTFTAHAKDIFHEAVDRADLHAKLQDAGAVITVSEYNVSYLQDLYGHAAARVQRIYNGLDLTKFRYATPLDRPRQIVGVGRLIEKKGFGDLIDACALLRDRGVDFTCAIIGEGSDRKALHARIDQHNLSDLVRLLGPRPQAAVIEHVQGAAVFAAPCVIGGDGNRDGLPTVLLEAMALGTPCIATDVTGIPELLQPTAGEETGLLIPQHDPAALAAALQALLDSPRLRVQLAERARQQIETHFDIQKNTAHIRKLYANLSPQLAEQQAWEVA
ncbi:MAG: glycosyltransferase [Caldilineaceae bacterium]|nr:glycosyltransferase [Caldilineaceae bacterium]